MRFARLQCDAELTPAGIEELALRGQLDLLQLDYPRPRWASAEGTSEIALPECAVGFRDALRAIAKPLYLDPDLQVIASAGWADAYACVEEAADVLVACGCGDVPVAAVRGSNVLPVLEMLESEGVSLANGETGPPWRELRSPLLAADLKIGAGPLTTALAEQARVIVAGAFADCAPAVACSLHAANWEWRQHDRLAAAAVAAMASDWVDWTSIATVATTGASQAHLLDIDREGRIVLESTSDTTPAAATNLQEWLRGQQPAHYGASPDARIDLAAVVCSSRGRQLAIEGTRGSAADDCWRLEILYEAGFIVESMIEFTDQANDAWREQFVGVTQLALQREFEERGLLTIEHLHSTSSAAGWLHVSYQSPKRESCQRFAEFVAKLAASQQPRLRLAGGKPAVHVHCGVWPVSMPRDAVDIAVETRLASEWV